MPQVANIRTVHQKTEHISKEIELFSMLTEVTGLQFKSLLASWMMRQEWKGIEKDINLFLNSSISIDDNDTLAKKMYGMVHSLQKQVTVIDSGIRLIKRKRQFHIQVMLKLQKNIMKKHYEQIAHIRMLVLEHDAECSKVVGTFSNADDLLNSLNA